MHSKPASFNSWETIASTRECATFLPNKKHGHWKCTKCLCQRGRIHFSMWLYNQKIRKKKVGSVCCDTCFMTKNQKWQEKSILHQSAEDRGQKPSLRKMIFPKNGQENMEAVI